MSNRLPETTLLKRRVRRGARFLDEKRPGWHNTIDREWLDLGDSGACVLGQLEGGYLVGLRNLGLRFPSFGSIFHGFEADGVLSMLMGHQYSFLTELWIEEIRARIKN